MRIRKIPLRHMWSKNKTRIRQRNLPFTIKDALNHIQQENVFKPLIILMLRQEINELKEETKIDK